LQKFISKCPFNKIKAWYFVSFNRKDTNGINNKGAISIGEMLENNDSIIHLSLSMLVFKENSWK